MEKLTLSYGLYPGHHLVYILLIFQGLASSQPLGLSWIVTFV